MGRHPLGGKQWVQGKSNRALILDTSTGAKAVVHAYLSLDRPDLGHAVKCLSRHMQQPTASDLADLKRVGRYLHNHRCLVNVYHRQSWPGKVPVTVDTDFAGDQTSGKSTTGVATATCSPQ
eukprot:6490815-Amphidinium_carterae.3